MSSSAPSVATMHLHEDVFVTAKLMERPAKRDDLRAEKSALQQLAGRMADDPADLLPHFVELAMALTAADSAGVSIYDEEKEPDVIEWRFLKGALAPFDHVKTPRNNSPCGIALDLNQPVLVAHPETLYDWIADEHIIIAEALLMPLYIGGDPLGTLWVVADEEGYFDGGDARALSELAAFVGIALRMLRAENRLRTALDEQEIVAREMSHRVKNIFQLTDGIIQISARNAETPAGMATALSGRLSALASAHALIRQRVCELDGAADTADLATLIHAVVLAHDGPEWETDHRFSLHGPEVRLGGHATNGIALLIHELATNASKYGALSSAAGAVHIRWAFSGPHLVLSWTECGGPPIEKTPERKGFGTMLATRTTEGQFKGRFEPDWKPEGLVVTMLLDTERLAH